MGGQDGQVTTATEVPVRTDMDGDELNAEDASNTVRHHGLRALAVESFLRFRSRDGFTNSRALTTAGRSAASTVRSLV